MQINSSSRYQELIENKIFKSNVKSEELLISLVKKNLYLITLGPQNIQQLLEEFMVYFNQCEPSQQSIGLTMKEMQSYMRPNLEDKLSLGLSPGLIDEDNKLVRAFINSDFSMTTNYTEKFTDKLQYYHDSCDYVYDFYNKQKGIKGKGVCASWGSLAVHPDYQGMKLGKLLIAEAIKLAYDKGFKEGIVSISNPRTTSSFYSLSDRTELLFELENRKYTGANGKNLYDIDGKMELIFLDLRQK